jgi:rubrerythrin
MDTQFNVYEILQIAEEVERKPARFYLRAAERCSDAQRRSTYFELASWRGRHQKAWFRLRREYSEQTGDFGTFDPDDYVLSNPQVMASLTSFGTDCSGHSRLTGHESAERILRDAIGRSQEIAIFYDGLKGFAGDPNARMMIDNMISEEVRHVRLLTRSLDRMHVANRRPGQASSTRWGAATQSLVL